jgi:hypothetical protein
VTIFDAACSGMRSVRGFAVDYSLRLKCAVRIVMMRYVGWRIWNV